MTPAASPAWVVAGAWLVPWGFARLGTRLLVARGRTVVNYRGRPVPLGLGFSWLGWGMGALALAVVSWAQDGAGIAPPPVFALAPAALVTAVAALGLADDLWGAPDVRGLAGHLGALVRGRLTTGAVKLVGICACSLAAGAVVAADGMSGSTAWGPREVAVWLLAAAVIALTANLVNLLDLRPGRALKAYVLLAAPAAVAGALPSAADAGASLLLVLGPAAVVWRADVGERAMLGDMGANAAGALAGWLLAVTLPLAGLAVAATALLLLTVLSERVSFSAVIEGNAVLRRLDRLGRPRRYDRTTDGT